MYGRQLLSVPLLENIMGQIIIYKITFVLLSVGLSVRASTVAIFVRF